MTLEFENLEIISILKGGRFKMATLLLVTPYKVVLQRVMNYPGTRKYQEGGYPARNRFFEICHYPDPARNRVLLPGGYPGN